MAVDGHYETWSIKTGQPMEDLTPGTGVIFKAVALDSGAIAQNGRQAGGILLTGGKTGEPVLLGHAGVMKFTAGGLVAAGRRMTVTLSGYFVEAASGSYVVGRCLDSAVNSGAVGTGLFNFSNAAYMAHIGELA
ncbi:MAG: hypothetical protein OEW12_06255 [Deltaproteobacteria bacterium]|nr:hypothetical protein [Deltaproteobacteria bacterium]